MEGAPPPMDAPMDVDDLPEPEPEPQVQPRPRGKAKKAGKGPKAAAKKGPAPGPVRGDHSLAVAAPEVAEQPGPRGHHRVSSGGLPGVKHPRQTPSPSATHRKGTPSPSKTAAGKGRSGSSSPRADALRAAQPATASRSPSPGMPGSPSPPAESGAGDGRQRKASPIAHGGVSKHRGRRGTSGGGRGGAGAAARKQATRPMSKSFDATTERDMKAIKNAFHAPDGFAAARSSQIPPPAMQSAPTVGAQAGAGDEDDVESEDFVLDEELCSLHEESVHGDDEMGEVDALSGDHSISSSFTSGSALGTGAFLPVGKAHQMTGLDEWVAEAASQRNLPVPQGKQRLDDLLSESEHYAVKNPEEIQIHPEMIGNNIWNRMKALEKLVELQRSAQLGELVGPPERGAGKAGGGAAGGAAAPPRVDSWSVKDIEREILSLSDTYPAQPQGGAAVAGGGGEAPLLQRQMSGGAAAPDADMMVNGRGKGSAERVAASPQSNGSKNFTNERHDVPKIDLAGVAPTSEAVTPRVETGSNYSEEGSGSVSAEDRVAAELPEATLKMPESPSASSGGTGAGSVGVGGDFRSPRSAFSTTSSQAGSVDGGSVDGGS